MSSTVGAKFGIGVALPVLGMVAVYVVDRDTRSAQLHGPAITVTLPAPPAAADDGAGDDDDDDDDAY
jgi:hypothetical protein